jgi:hypothetical protein
VFKTWRAVFALPYLGDLVEAVLGGAAQRGGERGGEYGEHGDGDEEHAGGGERGGLLDAVNEGLTLVISSLFYEASSLYWYQVTSGDDLSGCNDDIAAMAAV